MTDEQTPRPSISSVDARVGRLEDAQGRLEARQLEQDGVMRLIQLEQTHIREIMTSRFVSLEAAMATHGTKLDNFIGRMDALIDKAMAQAGDLDATPLGRQVGARLLAVEQEQEIQRDFRAEIRGVTTTVRVLTGGSVAGFLMALFALGKATGVI